MEILGITIFFYAESSPLSLPPEHPVYYRSVLNMNKYKPCVFNKDFVTAMKCFEYGCMECIYILKSILYYNLTGFNIIKFSKIV